MSDVVPPSPTRPGSPVYRLVRPHRAVPDAPVLDPTQRQVVEHGGGPLLVLAGPGTGKTTTLVEAVVARVRAGVPVEAILMLTFSRRAAAEMRDRVTARLGGTLREPIARTMHSYAFGVLRLANRRAEGEPLPPPRLLAAAEQDIMLRDLLGPEAAAGWPPELRPALRTRAFAGEVRDLLMRAVERGLDGPALAALGRSRGRPDWGAAGDFLAEYQQVTSLARPGAYDPAELIRSALNALHADPELLAAERARRRHIMVDEYQDTDPAQAELLALLAEGASELVLVGDPDQSIYAFRGADDSALREVDERFGRRGPVPVVALGTSRRSGPVLLAASRRVAERLPGRAEQRRLRSAATDPGRLDVAVFSTASAEAAYLAGVLRRAHLNGTPWSRMAVLVRSTAGTVTPLRRALLTAGVPVTVRGEDLPLAEQAAVTVLLDVVRFCLDAAALTDDDAERLLLGAVGGGDVVQVQRLRRALVRRFGADGGSLADAVGDPKGARLLADHVKWPVIRVASALDAGQRAVAGGGSVEDVLWAVWDASGLARRWMALSDVGGSTGAAAGRDLDAVVQLFEAAARFADRLPKASVRQFVEHLAAQQVPGDALAPPGRAVDAVSVLTAHASKGLEWDLVGVAHAQEGSWPDLRRRGSLLGVPDLVDAVAGVDAATPGSAAVQLAEERRLFYVAVTRARRHLVVTAVRGEDEQPSRFLDELDPVDADRPVTTVPPAAHLTGIVAELRSVVCDQSAVPADRAAAASELARLAVAGVRGADPVEWWGLAPLSDDRPVPDPDRPVRISPSRIDSFLRCELRTVLQDFGARDGEGLAASLGTVIHDVAATAPPDATVAQLGALLDEQWSGLDFGVRWHAENERVRAGQILDRLAAWLHDSRGRLDLVAVEQEFSVNIGDAVLSGRVDRLERDRDGHLVVVDLKTGKSKPGKDDLPAHPQLGAYQLAVEAEGFGTDEQSGGAMLVQLAAAGRDPEQVQGPLTAAENPEWAREQVAHVAARLRGSTFAATISAGCGNCDLHTSCPLQAGRQVTG